MVKHRKKHSNVVPLRRRKATKAKKKPAGAKASPAAPDATVAVEPPRKPVVHVIVVCPTCKGDPEKVECWECGGLGERPVMLVSEVKHVKTPCCNAPWKRSLTTPPLVWVCPVCGAGYRHEDVFDSGGG